MPECLVTFWPQNRSISVPKGVSLLASVNPLLSVKPDRTAPLVR